MNSPPWCARRARYTPLRSMLLAALVCALWLAAADAAAEPVAEEEIDETVVEEEAVQPPDPSGWRAQSALALRAIPIGLRVNLQGGYRLDLFDSESLLLESAYAEGGIYSEVTPSNVWAGPYIEVVPVAVLKLRAQALYLNYYGTFGYLHVPENQADPDWTLDVIGEQDGFATSGYLIDLRATPQIKLGNVVAFSEFQYTMVDMDIDQLYYESSFDFLLEPDDSFWVARPTAGYVISFDESWVLPAFRWEHAEASGTELTRDLASLLVLYKLPGSLGGGEMKLAVVAGYWVNHPNREEDPWYGATQFSVDWGG